MPFKNHSHSYAQVTEEQLGGWDHQSQGFYSHWVFVPYGSPPVWVEGQVNDTLPYWSEVDRLMADEYVSLIQEGSGWPMVGLKSAFHEYVAIKGQRAAVIDTGIRIGNLKLNGKARTLEQLDPVMNAKSTTDRDIWVLPTQIVWPGFLVNAVVWSLPWLVFLFSGVFVRATRFRKRRKRAHCYQCNYALQNLESKRCPECGWIKDDRPPLIKDGFNRLLVVGLILLLVFETSVVVVGILNRTGPERIHLAALTGDIETIQCELDRGIPVDHPVTTGDLAIHDTTPLFWATFGSQVEAVELLLEHGADTDLQDSVTNQPIHYAVRLYSIDVLNALVESGADVSTEGEYRQTPLHMLTFLGRIGRPEFIPVVVDHGADMNVIDQLRQTPLINAIRGDHYELATLFLDRGAFTSIEGAMSQPIRVAVQGDIRYVQLLLDYGLDLTKTKVDVIQAAIGYPNANEMIAFLLEHGVSPDRNPNSIGGRVPIIDCIDSGELSSFQILEEAGANLQAKDTDGNTILHLYDTWAYETDEWWENETWLAYLATLDLDFNATNNQGLTPLMVHTWYGHERTIRFLLENGADSSLKCKSGALINLRAIDFVDRIRDDEHELHPASFRVRERIKQTLADAMKRDR